MDCTDVLLLLTGVVAVAYFWSKYNFSYWRRKNVPYIEPTPFIGNTKEAFTLKTSFGLHLSDIYNDPKVSDAAAVGVYTLNQPGLVIRDLELIKSVLVKEFNKFSNRYATADPHGDALAANTLFFVRNPHWKEIRSKLSPVFTSGKIKQMYPLMLEVATDLETHLADYFKNGSELVTEVKNICALFTTDLIATIAFGIRANSLKDPNAEFRVQGRKVFDFNLIRGFHWFVGFYLPKLVSILRIKFFDKEFSHFARNSLKFVMSERQRTGTCRNDLIDILVGMKKDIDQLEGDHYSKNGDYLVAQATVFLTAGFETSSSTMAFALYELSKHPELQKRLRAEICNALVAEDGKLSYETISSLEYLNMVVDEVLRLYPVLPFLDREYTSIPGEKDFTLQPYYDFTMPSGMPVFIPVYGIHHNPKYWPNPNKFDPERFSSENKKTHISMSYLPFGGGPHNCIGNRIGLLQAKIGLVHIFKNHCVKVCDKTLKEMRFDPKSLVLQCAGGIHLNIVNDRLYEIEANKLKM